jgi:hypothetical protein
MTSGIAAIVLAFYVVGLTTYGRIAGFGQILQSQRGLLARFPKPTEAETAGESASSPLSPSRARSRAAA